MRYFINFIENIRSSVSNALGYWKTYKEERERQRFEHYQEEMFGPVVTTMEDGTFRRRADPARKREMHDLCDYLDAPHIVKESLDFDDWVHMRN